MLMQGTGCALQNNFGINFKGGLQNNNTALLQDLLSLTCKMSNSFKIDKGLQHE